MYYTIYKITNTVNNKIYIGQHQTEDIDDGYMGSGTVLLRAKKKYGVDKFKKETLYIFDNFKDMDLMESEIVDEEFVSRRDTYNVVLGGSPSNDKNDKYFTIYKNDPRYLSGELSGCTSGKLAVKDSEGNIFQVSIDDPRYLSGELKFINADRISIRDSEGNTFQVSIDDPRYLSGELVPVWTGKRHNEESKKKIGKANSIAQKGSGNCNYGRCWIYNLELQQSKPISKDELNDWINKGWIKGRKMNF